MRHPGKTAGVLGTGTYFAVIVDDVFDQDWQALWVMTEPAVKSLAVMLLVFLWAKIDRDRDGIPNFLDTDTDTDTDDLPDGPDGRDLTRRESRALRKQGGLR